jgi:hypothetical protein
MVDLQYLGGLAAGDQEVPIGVDVDRIDVYVIERARRQVVVAVGDGDVVPAPPLEHHVLGRVELLEYGAIDDGVGLSARDHLAHVDDLGVVCHHDGMTVGEKEELMKVRRITVPALERIDDRQRAVHDHLDRPGDPDGAGDSRHARVREEPVGLYFEIVVGKRACVPVPDRIARVVEHHRIEPETRQYVRRRQEQ